MGAKQSEVRAEIERIRGNKPYEAVLKAGTTLYEVKMKGGGWVPLPLRGFFTNEPNALRAIERYYATSTG